MMWSVVVPARVVERTGILGSFGRSRALTRGNRWRVLLLFIILMVLQIAVGSVIGALVSPFGAPAPPTAGSDLAVFFGSMMMARVIAETIASSVVAIVGTAIFAALYYELRVLKEGIGPEALASVFD
jgi:hypothetical protein